jgi:hypothetical protein
MWLESKYATRLPHGKWSHLHAKDANEIFVGMMKTISQEIVSLCLCINVNVRSLLGCLVVNTNILTLFYSRILYSTCDFQTYKVCLITIIKIRGKSQEKMHYNIHICTISVFVEI